MSPDWLPLIGDRLLTMRCLSLSNTFRWLRAVAGEFMFFCEKLPAALRRPAQPAVATMSC
ncbi:hypothetical protein [Enterobacter roggenkampii]|uniref:hypothetical protein n=1 Tax=Enterobacter roggenkampii TaxID=1812935 RepID=UPI00107EC26C|nr:hypothetical protein [Enterobacter roggenkampii]QBX83345.1 hypothetical protein E4005_00015 [Enterobacter roggenkampii]